MTEEYKTPHINSLISEIIQRAVDFQLDAVLLEKFTKLLIKSHKIKILERAVIPALEAIYEACVSNYFLLMRQKLAHQPLDAQQFQIKMQQMLLFACKVLELVLTHHGKSANFKLNNLIGNLRKFIEQSRWHKVESARNNPFHKLDSLLSGFNLENIEPSDHKDLSCNEKMLEKVELVIKVCKTRVLKWDWELENIDSIFSKRKEYQHKIKKSLMFLKDLLFEVSESTTYLENPLQLQRLNTSKEELDIFIKYIELDLSYYAETEAGMSKIDITFFSQKSTVPPGELDIKNKLCDKKEHKGEVENLFRISLGGGPNPK